MKTLIAIITCNGREDWVNIIRNTWEPLVKDADILFFKDGSYIHCKDDYQGLPNKVQEIVRWALDNHYDYMLKCDDDVVLNPVNLLKSGFEQHDFVGHECAPLNQTPYGFCYWMSKKLMQLVVDSPLPQSNNDEAWVASIANKNGILLHHDSRYKLHYARNLELSPNHRPLRTPEIKMETSLEVPVFAWCMHNHNIDKRLMQEEFKKVFRTRVKTQ